MSHGYCPRGVSPWRCRPVDAVGIGAGSASVSRRGREGWKVPLRPDSGLWRPACRRRVTVSLCVDQREGWPKNVPTQIGYCPHGVSPTALAECLRTKSVSCHLFFLFFVLSFSPAYVGSRARRILPVALAPGYWRSMTRGVAPRSIDTPRVSVDCRRARRGVRARRRVLRARLSHRF